MPKAATCARKGCGLVVDEAGLCFAHRAAKLLETIGEVMAQRKMLSATAGGVSVTMHPEGWTREEVATARRPGGITAPPSGGDEPLDPDEIGLREMDGLLGGTLNGAKFDRSLAFAASEGDGPDD